MSEAPVHKHGLHHSDAPCSKAASFPEQLVARKFLYVIAGIIVLVLLVLLALRLFGAQLSRIAFVPGEAFNDQPALAGDAYASPKMWIARPDIASNPAQWIPTGAPKNISQDNDIAVFFVHPTSFLSNDHWNAPLDNKEANETAIQFVSGQASALNTAPNIWAPRYRQAAFGAFLTDQPEAAKALALAYRDVLMAFDAFVAAQKPDAPILLAGHSQGALHLTHLLKDRVAGKPIAKRIVAAYVVGWPISVTADMPKIGLPACRGPDDTGCIMAWQSFAEPAEYDRMVKVYNATNGFTGQPRKDTAMLCTNPLNGGAAPAALMKANLGTLKPDDKMITGALIVGAVPARCDDKGFLLIGDPPEIGPYVLPGNNYHVYDFPLFWANVRADATWRLRKFLQK
jgi:hypothetical protein